MHVGTVKKILKLLEREYPNAATALRYKNPLELLIATILSAQCTDKVVNKVTKTLFKEFNEAEDYAEASLNKLEAIIKPTGFYHNKAKNIKKCCQTLVQQFNSEVPKTMGEMLQLSGVGRKTANIVLSNAYGVVAGIAVDTHVRRLSQRLSLSEHDDPDKIEKDLMRLIPRKKWREISDLLISHGRRICIARKPKCGVCTLNKLCASAFTFS